MAPTPSTEKRFQFERTYDYDLLNKLLVRDPQLYPFLGDDFAPSIEEASVGESPALWYIVAREGEELLGFWMFEPRSTILFEFHTIMPLDGRALRAFDELLGPDGWLWKNTPCVRAVTFVPDSNEIAHRFGLRAGLKAYGRNPKSYQKGGALQDLILLGISKS
jgi:hypothetical protein